MPCLVGCLALVFPRVALLFVWLFGGNYLERAYQSEWLWPLLGFLFLPLTTLAFAYGANSLGSGGDMPPLGWLLVVLALLIDLGLIGGGGRSAYRFRLERNG
jgi:hypothetical protein